MSTTLTQLLAIAGGLVLAGVVAHGAWAARKAGPKRAAPPPQEEPHFGLAPAGEPEVPGEPAPEVDPLEVTLPAVARPVRRPSARIDALIDAIATITIESPVSGELALQHQPGSRRAGTKPLQIEGMNTVSGDWELPAPGQRYSEFQAGLKMANCSGALNEIEYPSSCRRSRPLRMALAGLCSSRTCSTWWPGRGAGSIRGQPRCAARAAAARQGRRLDAWLRAAGGRPPRLRGRCLAGAAGDAF